METERSESPPSDVCAEFLEWLSEHAGNTDKVLFDGRWLTPQEAERRYRRLKWRSRFKVMELIVLFVLLAAIALVPSIVLGQLGAIVA